MVLPLYIWKFFVLDYDDSVKLYNITPKGRQFLELYNKMAKMLELVS